MYIPTRADLPDDLVRNNLQYAGTAGREWLDALPSVLTATASRWDLTLERPYPLSFNYVAPARRKGTERVVLKACAPGGEFVAQVRALQVYAGRGSVRLLESDSATNVMLLEYLDPGSMLIDNGSDGEQTVIAAQVMRVLWQSPPAVHGFGHITDWFRNGFAELRASFGGGTGPFPPLLVESAERLFPTLLRTAGPDVVLHGDLHHYNILSSQRGWLAIDPKGILGEPAFEVAPFMHNPSPQIYTHPNLCTLLDRRLALLSTILSIPRARLLGWSLAFAVLSTWWNYSEVDSVWQTELPLAWALHALHVAEVSTV